MKNIDMRIAEPAQIIMRYFKSTKHKQDERNFKKGKSLLKSSTKNLKSSFPIKAQRNSLPTVLKFDEIQMFTQNRIDAFLKQGETEEIKNDKSYDAFRIFMNERCLNYDQNPFIDSKIKEEEVKNEFRWLNDPTYKIESDSSEEEKDTRNPSKFRVSLNPSDAKIFNHSSKYIDKASNSSMSKIKNSSRARSPVASSRFIQNKDIRLSHPSKSKLMERREE